LTGEHRFSRYSLTFTLTRRPDATVLSARTHAQFPGLHGQAYRDLVITSQGHRVLVQRLLRSVRRRALALRSDGDAGHSVGSAGDGSGRPSARGWADPG
jgi:hypothetical protein